jgi:transposase
MTIRLHLRRLRVVEVIEDVVERLVVAVQDLRTVVRCPHCGFLTARVDERRRVKVHDLAHGGRPTMLVCGAASVAVIAGSGIPSPTPRFEAR